MRFIKVIFSIQLILLWISTPLFAQVDRSEPPKAGPAPEINLKKPVTFTLDNGLEVIVSENHKLPQVSFQLSVDADPVMEKQAVGYVSATGSLLRNGTKNREKAEIDEAVDFIGASLATYTNGIYASSLSKHKDELLDIMVDVLKNPTFPAEEVEKYKQRQISSLNASQTNPTAIARRVAKKLRFKEHPYGEITTVETIKNITRQKLKDYYSTYYKPNNSYLVIVGDIKPAEAKKTARKYFGDWEKGDVPTHKYEFPGRNEASQVSMVNMDDSEQSVISITYPVELKTGDEDAIPARITNSILGGGVFSGYLMQNLREDKGYTYGARSSLNRDEYVGYFRAGAEVKSSVTDSAVTQFLKEMNRIRNEKVTGEHLNLVKSVLSGRFARSLERPRTFANFALNIKKYDLPDDYYANYLKKIEAVSRDEVQDMARKYILPEKASILVVGDSEKLLERLKQFDADNEIQMYDAYGAEVKTSQAEEGMTAEKVIERYIEARGGRENLSKIKELVRVAEANIQGNAITAKTYKKAPDMYATEMHMGGRLIQKQVYNGEKGKVVNAMRNQEQELSGDKLKEMKYEATLHNFMKYDELKVKTELKGVEETNGKKAYKVLVTLPTGKEITQFYSKDTGLLVKTMTPQNTPRGKVTVVQEYKDYQKKEGVMFPYKVAISGAQNITLNVQEVKLNSGIQDKLFQ